jgi:glycosyltransferase involved in cell wall biosynthesis
MRILCYIHTFNDRDVIGQLLEGVHRQTRRPDALLIVDNASTDGTLDRTFPHDVTIIRNPQNLGTSGAIRIGFAYALKHRFDWMWILDADSIPDPGALATLLNEYAGWPAARQQQTAFIACLPLDQPGDTPRHGRFFTRRGRAVITPHPNQRYYQCHITIWSGCLYRLAAVKQIGLPNPDYFLDRGELEYAYRIMKAGYLSFIHQDAITRQNIRGEPLPRRIKDGSITPQFFEAAPIRCYMLCRNTLYFTLYDLHEGALAKLAELFRLTPRPGRGPLSGIAWQTILLTLNFALRPRGHKAQILACLRGIWHGLTGNIAARY